MRKVLFLDLDGVLNTGRWHSQASRNELHDEYGDKFDPASVANLAKIIDETGADIVISSTWKFMGLSMMKNMWKDRKLPGKVIGITPNTIGDDFLLNADLDNVDIMAIRGQEIKEWLMLNGNDVTHYAILDDMDDILQEQEDHFVWINPEVGITEDDAFKVISILNHLEH